MKSYTKNDKTSYQEVKQTLHYDPLSGVFTHLTLVGRRIRYRPGDIGGKQYNNGYVWVTTHSGKELASRLAWLYMTGSYPPENYMVDHIDTRRFNNSWKNLRLATHAQNCQNASRMSNNSTGVKGITITYCLGRKNKYVATVQKNGKKEFQKTFYTLKEATIAVKKARENLHGEFANHE